jgi:hypothetical protein
MLMADVAQPRRRKAPSNKTRQARHLQRLAQQRAQTEQVAEWIRRFDTNRSGKLERDELAVLLRHLHPEAGEPDPRALDLLITQATEIKTYSMQLKGNPHGAVGANCLNAVVRGYGMFLLASAAFDRLSCEGVVALRDLPGLVSACTETNAVISRRNPHVTCAWRAACGYADARSQRRACMRLSGR